MLKQYEDYFEADVFRNGDYDCTNNGASKRHNSLFVVAKHVSYNDVFQLVEYMKKNGKQVETDQFFKVDYDFYYRSDYIRLIPIDREINGRHSMFGGNYLTTCDSRFKKFVCYCPYPVPIHDRYE